MRYFLSWVLLIGAIVSGVLYTYNPDEHAFTVYLAHQARQTIAAEMHESESMPLLFGAGPVARRTIERVDHRLYSIFTVRIVEGNKTTVQRFLGVAGLFSVISE